MKTAPFALPPPTRQLKGAFTLLELSLALIIGMMVGAMVLALANQQFAFLQIYRSQSFLNEEAPLINRHIQQIVARADRFRLHDSLADALANRNPKLTSSPVLVLNFREPNGTMRAGILSFLPSGSERALTYHLVPNSGTLGKPNLTLSKRLNTASFAVENGILRVRLRGPAGEEIVYSTTSR